MADANAIVLKPAIPPGATEAQRRRALEHAADFARGLKLRELRAGKGVSGKPLVPVLPESRPDGATGAPLSPHRAESRSQKWLRVSIGYVAGTVTLWWSHGWGVVLNYHREGIGRRDMPGGKVYRDVIGLTERDVRAHEAEMARWWKLQGVKAATKAELAEAEKHLEKKAVPAGTVEVEHFTHAVFHAAKPKAAGPARAGDFVTGFYQFAEEKVKVKTPAPPKPPVPVPVVARAVPKPVVARVAPPSPAPAPKYAAATKVAPSRAEPVAPAERRPAAVPVRLSFHGEVSGEARSRAEAIVASLPARVREALAAHGTEFRVGRAMRDVIPAEVDERPRGWPAGMTWAHSEGFHDPGRRWVVANETLLAYPGNSELRSFRFRGVLHHEAGHAFDSATGRPSDSDAFRAAYEADRGAIAGADRGPLGYFLQEGHAGRGEAFAELFAQALGEGAAGHLALAGHFPRAAAIVRELIR